MLRRVQSLTEVSLLLHFRSLRWSGTMSGIRDIVSLTRNERSNALLVDPRCLSSRTRCASFSTSPGGRDTSFAHAQHPITLVAIGSGKYRVFEHAGVRTFSDAALLLALKKSDMFSDDLKGIPLSKCSVLVVRGAGKVPSEEEEKSAVELIGADTIGEVFEGTGGAAPPAGSKVFLRVKLPLPVPSQGDGSKAAAEQDAPLKKLRLALLSASLEAIVGSQSGAQLIRLPSDLKWPQLGSQPLFVRHFYKDCAEGAMSNMRPGGRFIVRGNGGIGKSAFGLYLLWRAVISRRTVIYVSDKVSKGFIFHADGRVEAFPPVRANFLATLRHIIEDEQTVLIFDGDGDGSPPPIVEATTVLVTSPKLKRYSLFEKTGATHLVFPVFSRAEMQDMLESCFPHLHCADARSQVEERYLKWGGIPRYVLALLEESDQAELENALGVGSLQKMLDALGKGDIEDDRAVSHRLVHLTPRGKSASGEFAGGADKGAYTLACTEFGSAYIKDTVHKALMGSNAKEIFAFLAQVPTKGSPLSNLHGQVFERYAIKVLQKGGVFETYALDSSLPHTKREGKVVLPPSNSAYFSKCDELTPGDGGVRGHSTAVTLSPQRTFIPRSKNFASIDLILPGQRLANVTINDEHALLLYAKDGTQGLVPVAKALGIADGGQRIPFFWVMPRERYDIACRKGTPFPVRGVPPPPRTAGVKQSSSHASPTNAHVAAAVAGNNSASDSEVLVAPAAAGSSNSAATVSTPDDDVKNRIDQYLLLLPFEESLA